MLLPFFANVTVDLLLEVFHLRTFKAKLTSMSEKKPYSSILDKMHYEIKNITFNKFVAVSGLWLPLAKF